ncbi:MAG: putative Na+/H+ antiporter, partial [Gammaproteobacteria bacterium]
CMMRSPLVGMITNPGDRRTSGKFPSPENILNRADITALFVGIPQALTPLSTPLSVSDAVFFGAAVLTAFTDNAALTYLGSLVEGLSDGFKYALVAGAVTGGGLTILPGRIEMTIEGSTLYEIDPEGCYVFVRRATRLGGQLGFSWFWRFGLRRLRSRGWGQVS